MSYQKIIKWIVHGGILLNTSLLHAGIPVWVFTALGPTQLSVKENATITVQYTVRNQSNKSKNLVLQTTRGLAQNGSCQLAPRGQTGSTCTLSLTITGKNLPKEGIRKGPFLCEANANGSPNLNQCYGPDLANTLHIQKLFIPILTASSTFILPKQGLFTAASGAGTQADCQAHGGVWNEATSPAFCESKTRHLIITNTGSMTAFNVAYTISPALPSGTSISPSFCGTIPPKEHCLLSITPGATPNTPSPLKVIPSVLTLSGDNVPDQSVVNIAVLTYGNIYQNGYVFSMNDTVSVEQGATGAAIALVDQTSPQPPAENGVHWSPDLSSIPGINETSVNPPDNCNGKSDGLCNTRQITAYYLGSDLNSYAAGQCKAYKGGGYQDWYLPAICEMGFQGNNDDVSGCGVRATPALQNIESNIVLGTSILIHGGYWSSTQVSNDPIQLAWGDTFFNNPLYQGPSYTHKTLPIGVRCARHFH